MDYEKEIVDLKEDMAGVKSDVKNLCGWQSTQNGALLRVDAKVDALKNWLMGVAVGLAINLLMVIFNFLKG